MKIISINPIHPEKDKIKEATKWIKRGKIAAFPTDTVYGLGVDAENKEAINKLYRLKKRPKNKPFVLFIIEKEEALRFAKTIPLSAQKLINEFWPGPLTLIFQANISCPPDLISKEGKIGIRFPSHSIPQKIIREGKILLATTSANPSREANSLKIEEISKSIREKIDLIIDGGSALLGEASTIVDTTSSPPRLIREGWISREEIGKVCKKEGNILFVCTGNTCRSPMAERIFKKIWLGEKVKVCSAGTSTLRDSGASKLAIKVMEEKGVNLSSHRSAPLNMKLIQEADLILVMENKHKRKILELSPLLKGKVFLLKKFAQGLDEEFPDPIGEAEESYEECAQQMEETIERVIKKLGG
ncbi:MAG: L-threonylcarbamoyladenylate synthase [Candidatus Aerophobetes bacterium]|nr:L-threonylcarbamoyladenylate synthase [Candidatus Aerophobetes bacterium]